MGYKRQHGVWSLYKGLGRAPRAQFWVGRGGAGLLIPARWGWHETLYHFHPARIVLCTTPSPAPVYWDWTLGNRTAPIQLGSGPSLMEVVQGLGAKTMSSTSTKSIPCISCIHNFVERNQNCVLQCQSCNAINPLQAPTEGNAIIQMNFDL